MRRLTATLVACAIGGSVLAEDPKPADLLAANTHAFSFDGGELSGPGWELLRHETAKSQFVLLGEGHDDKLTPIFAGALYKSLRKAHAFSYLVVEQAPLAIELACDPKRRGLPDAVAEVSKRYPTLFEFSSDQDLTLLAEACAAGGRPSPVWGVEQALGAERYLEELIPLAPNPEARKLATAELEEARRVEKTRQDYGKYLHDDAGTEGRLRSLTRAFAAKPGTRAAFLLDGLLRSAVIFGYNRRAGAGEYVGLFNNTEREVEFKAHFRRLYREASPHGLPKALFKFGSWHMYRGRSPGTAFTIGNHAYEVAIFNGHDAYGLMVLPGTAAWSDIPAWMRPVLPAQKPAVPTLVNLRALLPYQRLFRLQVEEKDQPQFRDLANAFDALVILPDGPPAEWHLTGFKPSR